MNALAILALVAKYGPTAVMLIEKYGPTVWAVGSKIVSVVEASAKAGTLDSGLEKAVSGGKALAAALGPIGSLADLGEVLSSVNAVDLGNPQPGDHTPSGSHR